MSIRKLFNHPRFSAKRRSRRSDSVWSGTRGWGSRLELLESRRLLAINTNFLAGALTITADAADNIAITEAGGNVQVNGLDVGVGVAAATVTSINITATGDFANTIDLTGVTPAAFVALASVSVDAGDGGDAINVATLTTGSVQLSGGTGADILNLLGGAITTTGDQEYGLPVSLAADTTINAGAANVTFGSTIDGAFALAVNSTGTTTFAGLVGGITPLTTLTTDAGGTSQLTGGGVATSGDQTYNDPVVLGADTTINAGAGNVTFASIVDGGFALAINSTGATNFGGAVGGIAPLASLATNAGGTTVSLLSVTTTGTQSYNDAAVNLNGNYTTTDSGFTVALSAILNGNTVVSTGTGNITFNGSINGGFTLALNSTGLTRLVGPVGSTTALTSLTTNAGGTTRLGGSITTTGAQSYGDPVELISHVLATSNGNQNITFGSTVDDDGLGPWDLRVNTGGVTTFAAAIGATVPPRSVFTNAGGTTRLGGNVRTATIQTFNDAVQLTANVIATSMANQDIAFNGKVDGDGLGPWDLTINTGAITTFADSVGSTAELNTLTTDPGGATASLMSVKTIGAQTYNDAIVNLNGLYQTTNSNFTINQTAVLAGNTTISTGAGNISFNGEVRGGFSLAANSSGTTKFAATVGTGTPLATLTTGAGGTTQLGNNVTTINGQTYGDPVQLTGNVTAASQANANIVFNSTVDADGGGARVLNVNTTGTTRFGSTVGAVNPLQSLATNAGGTTQLAGNVTTVNGQTYGDAVELTGHVVAASTANQNVLLASTVNGDGAGPWDLAVNTAGTTTFAATVGAGNALRALTTNSGGTTRLAGNVTTTNGQTYGDAVQLTGNVVATSTGNQAIAFQSTIDGDGAGPWDLTVNTTGLTTFSAAVGGTNALKGLTTNAGGTTRLGGNVTTSNGQTYGDAVILTGNVVSTSNGGGNVTFAGTIDGSFGLIVNTIGTTTFNGAVGASPLQSLATNATGTTRLNGGTYATNGPLTFGDNVELGANTTINSGSGEITFGGMVDGAFALAINTMGDTTFHSTVGGTTKLASVTTNSGGITASLKSVATTGAQAYNDMTVRLDGIYTTENSPFTIANTTILAGNSTVSTGSGDITFGGSINGAFSLVTTNSGTTTFGGIIGEITPLHSLDVTTVNALSFNHNVKVTNQISVLVQESAGANDLTIGSNVIFCSTAGNISLRAGDNVSLQSTSTVKADAAAGTIDIIGDFGSTDAAGTTIQLLGTLKAQTVTAAGNTDADTITLAGTQMITGLNPTIAVSLLGDDGDDTMNLQAVSAVAQVTAEGGNGNDVFNVGSGGAGSRLNGIAGSLTINGGANATDVANKVTLHSKTITRNQNFALDPVQGNSTLADATVQVDRGDRMNLLDSGQTTAAAYTITSTIVARTASPVTVNYAAIETLSLVTGSGNDSVKVQLPSAAPPLPSQVLIDGGNAGFDTLQVDGTTNADHITIGDNSLLPSQFQLAGMEGVKVFGGLGNDTLITANLSVQAQIFGELGNDDLVGGTANDRLDGGAGDDLIFGGEGNDLLVGGLGNDELRGNGGGDVIYGGGDIDCLFGEDGNDYLLPDHDPTSDLPVAGGVGKELVDGGAGINSAVSHGQDMLIKITGKFFADSAQLDVVTWLKGGFQLSSGGVVQEAKTKIPPPLF